MVKPHCSNPRVRSQIRQRTSAVERAQRLDERRTARPRLTDIERAERRLTELDFQRLIVGPTGLATALGWVHVHFRPAMTKRGWRTPGTGELAAGWPDLVLVRERDRRLVFAELKRELEQPRPDQATVLGVLTALAWPRCMCDGPLGGLTFGAIEADGKLHDSGCALIGGAFSGSATRIEVFVWRPSDLRDPIESSRIYEVLR